MKSSNARLSRPEADYLLRGFDLMIENIDVWIHICKHNDAPVPSVNTLIQIRNEVALARDQLLDLDSIWCTWSINEVISSILQAESGYREMTRKYCHTGPIATASTSMTPSYAKFART